MYLQNISPRSNRSYFRRRLCRHGKDSEELAQGRSGSGRTSLLRSIGSRGERTTVAVICRTGSYQGIGFDANARSLRRARRRYSGRQTRSSRPDDRRSTTVEPTQQDWRKPKRKAPDGPSLVRHRAWAECLFLGHTSDQVTPILSPHSQDAVSDAQRQQQGFTICLYGTDKTEWKRCRRARLSPRPRGVPNVVGVSCKVSMTRCTSSKKSDPWAADATS